MTSLKHSPARRRLILVVTFLLLGITSIWVAQKSAFALDPEYAEYNNLIVDAYGAKDWAKTLELCQISTRRWPDEWVDEMVAGSACRNLGDKDTEAIHLRAAIKKYDLGKATNPASTRQNFDMVLLNLSTNYLFSGELKGAMDLAERQIREFPESYAGYRTKGIILQWRGRPKEAIEALAKGLELHKKARATTKGHQAHMISGLGMALMQLGDFAAAKANFEGLLKHGGIHERTGHVGLGRYYAYPGNPELNPPKSAEHFDAVQDRSGAGKEDHAAIVFGIFQKWEESVMWSRLSKNALSVEASYYVGTAHLHLGQTDWAIERLTYAASMDPRWEKVIREHPFYASIRDLVLPQAEENRESDVLVRDEAKREVRIANQSRAFARDRIRAHNYEAAIDILVDLQSHARTPFVRDSSAEWLAEVREYQELKSRLIEHIMDDEADRLSFSLDEREDAEVVSADTNGIKLSVGGGEVEAPWAILPADVYFDFLRAARMSPRQWFVCGRLLYEIEHPELAEAALVQCLDDDAVGQDANRLVAEKRGVDVPAGGFARYKRKVVTKEEKDNLEKGLVLHDGEWMTTEDREHVRKGHIKQDGKWIDGSPEELIARGYRLHEGRWLTNAEYRMEMGDWNFALEKETRHFVVRTNLGQRFLDRLATALEDSYEMYAKHFRAEPPSDKKMRMLAFRDFDGFRDYCKQTENMSSINALGFAPSEPWTACGYDKFDDENSLIGTMVHEACHLFFMLAFPESDAPSWLAEGMATYMEGVTIGDDGALSWHHRPDTRIWVLRREAENKRLFTLEQMFGGNAGHLIRTDTQAALRFYSQAWAFYYFAHHSTNSKILKMGRLILQELMKGNSVNPREMFPDDFEMIQDEYVNFVRRLVPADQSELVEGDLSSLLDSDTRLAPARQVDEKKDRPAEAPRPKADDKKAAKYIKSKINLASNFINVRSYSKARKVLHEIIEKHPDHPDTAEARELLQEIEGK